VSNATRRTDRVPDSASLKASESGLSPRSYLASWGRVAVGGSRDVQQPRLPSLTCSSSRDCCSDLPADHPLAQGHRSTMLSPRWWRALALIVMECSARCSWCRFVSGAVGVVTSIPQAVGQRRRQGQGRG